MDVTGWVVFAVFGVSTIVAVVMFSRLMRIARSSGPGLKRAAAARRWALNMSLITGIWELSVAAVIIDTDSWGQAIGPLMIGIAMIAARWVVPAFSRRVG